MFLNTNNMNYTENFKEMESGVQSIIFNKC